MEVDVCISTKGVCPMAMKLNEFVTESLKQVFLGISDAKKYALEYGFQVNPWITSGKSDLTGTLVDRETKTPLQLVEFDVAVTVTETEQSGGGLGIFIAPIALGGKHQSDATNTVVSRIKFSVPLAFPRATDI